MEVTTSFNQMAHKNWATRPADQSFDTLRALRESVHARRLISRQADLSNKTLEVSAMDNNIIVHGDILPASVNHWSLGQLATEAGAPAGYMRKLPTNLAVDCLNHGIKVAKEKGIKLLSSTTSEDGLNLRGITSPSYGRIWDADVVDAVENILEKTGGEFFAPKDWSGKVSGLYASDRDIFMFHINGGSLVDGGGERDQLHRGFFVWNSEVGSATLGIRTFAFRAVCGNLLVWSPSSVKTLKIRHTSGGPARFVADAIPELQSYVSMSAEPFEREIRNAKAFAMPSEEEDKITFLTKNGLNKSEAKIALEYAEKEEGNSNNLWSVIQGVTASARAYSFMDAKVDLETRAGNLMKLAA